MTRGDEPCYILVFPFPSSVKVSVVGVCTSGLKVPCFVLVSVGNGHFGNGVIFDVAGSCRHGLRFLVLFRGTKMANYCI
jgi:hypothetical protein